MEYFFCLYCLQPQFSSVTNNFKKKFCCNLVTMSANIPRRRNVESHRGLINKDEIGDFKIARKTKQRWIHVCLITVSVALLIPSVLLIAIPSPVTAVEMELPEPPELTGPLTPNNILASADQIYYGQVDGPESVVVDGEHIYTGTADGWVVHMYKGVVNKIVRFGKEPCGGYENEVTCGRPLGMRMDKDGFLIVADAYYGLFKVNVVTGDNIALYSSSLPISGKKAKFINDLDIAPDGKIYFTDSSTKWHRNQFPMVFLEGVPNGRLLMYDPVKETTTEVLSGLLFSNGVQLTKDKTAILIAETFKARILKYNLLTKQTTIWADNLPGFPDNIRYSKITGTYWVGFGWIRQKGAFSLVDFLAPMPRLRSMLAKVMSIKLLLTLKQYFSHADSQAMAIELNEAGVIIRSIHDETGEVINSVSEVESSDGVLYFGSFHANYIGRLYRQRIPGL